VTATLTPTNQIGAMRARLWEVLSPCLPGRVYAYAPAQVSAQVAPALWIGDHNGALNRPLDVAYFVVTGVADGAGHAAQAMVDQLVSAVRSTLRGKASAPFVCENWQTGPVDVADDVTLRGVTFDISAPVDAISFCPDIPTASVIPPEIIQ
jgi:hypothetical protein